MTQQKPALKPGSLCPITGTYRAFTKDGTATYTQKRFQRGLRVSPTPTKGGYYRLQFSFTCQSEQTTNSDSGGGSIDFGNGFSSDSGGGVDVGNSP